MSRHTAQWFAIACFSLSLLTSACTRTDATGPSDQPAPSYDEGQGGNTRP
jgi:hypothetical protein